MVSYVGGEVKDRMFIVRMILSNGKGEVMAMSLVVFLVWTLTETNRNLGSYTEQHKRDRFVDKLTTLVGEFLERVLGPPLIQVARRSP